MVKSTSASKHRKLLERLYNERYKLHLISRDGCFYCGDAAGTVDHCPPLAWCDVKEKKWFEERKIKFWLVKCCNICNRWLRDKPIFTLEERTLEIKLLLEKKLNSMVSWEKWEQEEMSSMFKKMIKAKNIEKQKVQKKLQICNETLISTLDFPQ
jgi:hypothetical protein